MTRLLQGINASPGMAIAPILIYRDSQPVIEETTITDADAEIERLQAALRETRAELEKLRDSVKTKLGEEKAEIFEGHLMILEDPDLIDAVMEAIQNESVNAEYAVHTASSSFIEVLKQMDDEYLRERAADVRDVSGKLIGRLSGVTQTDLSQLTEPCIIIANDLAPSDTAKLDMGVVKGFITEIGSRTSHSAIMARSLGIPAIVGVGALSDDIQTGALALLDATNGTVTIEPSEEQHRDFIGKKEQYDQQQAELAKWVNRPSLSSDGHRVELAANIGKLEDVQKALDNGAEAIGLFRTEFLYMGRNSLPTEDEQFASYKYVLEKMNGKPVVIRTLDIGGDKELPYMELPKEANPFLGQRALRLCLERPELFRTQLRALLRASSYGNLKIMFPMIAVLSELRDAKALLEEERTKLLAEGIAVSDTIEIGMMVEIPAAAVSADLFAKEVDFFSIGTNDLIQYTMAADRMNETVSYLYQPCNPSVLRLVRIVVEAARKEGKWVGMCGEMAGDEAAIPLLLGLGLHEFSMSASSILSARAQIGELSYERWSQLAEQALTMATQDEIQDFVRSQS
ncbi:phosphoenolpyruvate--protein phosphotransferase [Paenibacillus sp. 1011MAR3C5]|uniref:phosphoenolpyruvate--protein phosphotransferase n=1 Tax=Paenibacillus sp. 1011MAR3C5 TaxID=1675787 RepID=UPI000E6D2FF9|nr:phosphoenolpyruvate--protein phosphotransferase [Paenibacillus sp. 1011MAR3C5]RJE90384.1 phosphoenolpyruvate--protein phosphotransferase [Paenibacillus sp. 1011MAR3C5]